MTVLEIAKKYHIKAPTVRARLKVLGLNVNISNYRYDKDTVFMVNCGYRSFSSKPKENHKLAFIILELYFFNNNNEVPEIAKALNISTSLANRVIDNYFKNKGLIVESKINEK